MLPRSLFRDTAVAAVHAARLGARPSLGLSKVAILRGMASIKRRRAGRALIGSTPARPLRLLGHTVHFLNLELLDHLYEEVFLREDYHFWASTPAPVILDCGSNIGMSILYFKALYPEARITGFEPTPDVYSVLRRNVEDNHLRDVTVHHRVLAPAPGSSTFYVDTETAGSLLTSTRAGRVPNASPIHVQNAVLSDYIDGPVDMLKMDIEGAEWEVLTELRDSGKLELVRALTLEYHHHIEPDDDRLGVMLRMLEEAGFGYHLGGKSRPPRLTGTFQDLMIYAYKK